MKNDNKRSILICDDNLLNRKLVAAMLAKSPYNVREATSGREAEAIVMADHDLIDLVLLDIGMKDLSGIDVCRAIRSSLQDQKRHLPIIAYTAHAMVNERERYLSAGFNDILTKPTQREELFAILDKYLN